jgi:TetR/AcrR family transcriptional repressor of nem operon
MRQCDSKLKLLQTAHELIWRQSYGSVGVDQICEHSGVKKGSFYHFFRSKSDLAVAAYEYHWQELREKLDIVFSKDKPPLDRLDDYFRHIYDRQRGRQERFGRMLGCPFVSLGSELSTQDESVRQMAQKISANKCKYIEETLSDAIEEGLIKPTDPAVLTRELHSYLVGLVQEAKIANDLRALNGMRAGAYRLLGVEAAALAS